MQNEASQGEEDEALHHERVSSGADEDDITEKQ